MAHKKVTISTTPEFERKVKKFLHSKELNGVKINRSELDRKGVELFMENEKNKRKPERREW